mmetsp:Transcript_40018/g.93949  ORF Transcript_40018/g.93949 Transcript_40018/m.93949 type:complete len:204 (-) Transcript_40018:1162-1773(-)
MHKNPTVMITRVKKKVTVCCNTRVTMLSSRLCHRTADGSAGSSISRYRSLNCKICSILFVLNLRSSFPYENACMTFLLPSSVSKVTKTWVTSSILSSSARAAMRSSTASIFFSSFRGASLQRKRHEAFSRMSAFVSSFRTVPAGSRNLRFSISTLRSTSALTRSSLLMTTVTEFTNSSLKGSKKSLQSSGSMDRAGGFFTWMA